MLFVGCVFVYKYTHTYICFAFMLKYKMIWTYEDIYNSTGIEWHRHTYTWDTWIYTDVHIDISETIFKRDISAVRE